MAVFSFLEEITDFSFEKGLKNNQITDPYSIQRQTYQEQTCSGPNLRGHIVNEHLIPSTLSWYDVPRFDIELAQARGFRLDWVVYKGVERLRDASRIIDEEEPLIRKRVLDLKNLSLVDEYRKNLARTLVLIGNYGLADNIDWEEVEKFVPNARDLIKELDLQVRPNPFPERWGWTRPVRPYKKMPFLEEPNQKNREIPIELILIDKKF